VLEADSRHPRSQQRAFAYGVTKPRARGSVPLMRRCVGMCAAWRSNPRAMRSRATSNVELPVLLRKRKKERVEEQTHGMEVDLTGARVDSFVRPLASMPHAAGDASPGPA
jgi:hypothetical protein